jgi:hypothetical protein
MLFLDLFERGLVSVGIIPSFKIQYKPWTMVKSQVFQRKNGKFVMNRVTDLLGDMLKSKSGRTVISVFYYHAPRRIEVANLRVTDMATILVWTRDCHRILL